MPSNILVRNERFSMMVISVGCGFAFSTSFSLVSLINSMALIRFASFSFINGLCLANFTKSAVSKRERKSAIASLSCISSSFSIISEEVISKALKPKRSLIYVRKVSVNSV